MRPVVEDGQITRLIGVERDVSARKASEEHERASSLRAATLADALSAEKSLLPLTPRCHHDRQRAQLHSAAMGTATMASCSR